MPDAPTTGEIMEEVKKLGNLKAAQKDLDALLQKVGDIDVKDMAEKLKGFDASLEKAIEDHKKALEDQEKLEEQIKELKNANRHHFRGAEPTDAAVIKLGLHKRVAAHYLCGLDAKGLQFKNKNVLKWAQDYIDQDTEVFKGDPNYEEISERRDAILGRGAFANAAQQRAALTTSNIPLPTTYSSMLIEFVQQFGTYSRYALNIPVGGEKMNVKHLTTDPDMQFIDMSGSVPEESPTLADVELDPEKAGAIVRVPTEIDQDSIVSVGAFISRWIARAAARWSDITGWTADGSGTYKTMEGVTDRVDDNSDTLDLTSGETATDDIVIADLRLLRGVPDVEAYDYDAAYYMHRSMEALLSSFNVSGSMPWDPINQRFDGFPVRWVNQLTAYSSTATVSTVVALFGAMNPGWALATRGGMRIDMSKDVYFATDEVGIRALWRFAVKELEVGSMAGIKTAAS